MKMEMTVSLPEELVEALRSRAPDSENRSELVETAVRAHLLRLWRRDSSRDLEIINAHTKELNEEAEDVPSYHVLP